MKNKKKQFYLEISLSARNLFTLLYWSKYLVGKILGKKSPNLANSFPNHLTHNTPFESGEIPMYVAFQLLFTLMIHRGYDHIAGK